MRIREAYEQAATLFVETVGRVAANHWKQQALGEWTVQDLVGHTNRALLTVETYLDNPAATRELERPVEYFLRALAALADPAAVAARGREAGKALGADPLAAVHETATRVLDRLRRTADETLLTTPVGGMRLIDYLPSRVFELTIHSLDLASALSLQVTVPEPAAKVTFSLLIELALHKGQATPLILSTAGRGPLPIGFSVL
ncbi:MAG: maleylpyruvate isomerase N-terminal domain-containing protein [bacterium]|nr:maleylpyruvate isomerase N-terminal domain-containing protein [bacterium]